MRCSKCGGLIDDNLAASHICRTETSVKILSRTERDEFTGETIDAPVLSGNRRSDDYFKYDRPKYNQNTRIYRFNLFPTSFIGKALAVFIVGILICITLPILFFAILLGIAAWLLFSRYR